MRGGYLPFALTTCLVGVSGVGHPVLLAEIEGFVSARRGEGAWPGGIHIEYTGQDVTECLGRPSSAVLEEQLAYRYETPCDPRLSARRSLDLAFRLAELMRAA